MAAPRVFVSYTWEDEEHTEWVTRFATRLREDGVDAWLDQWAMRGQSLAGTLASEIRHAHYVVVICTPRYREKAVVADEAQPSGVGYEARIISARLFYEGQKAKVVPVLVRGSWRDASPDFLFGEHYYDLSSPTDFERNYRMLLGSFWGGSGEAPPLGLPPTGIGLEPVSPLRGADRKTWREAAQNHGLAGRDAIKQTGGGVAHLFDACVQLGRLLTFARREIVLYPHVSSDRNEKAKYFLNVLLEHLFVRLLKAQPLVLFDAARRSENLRETFDILWEMAEAGDSQEYRLGYLSEIGESVGCFMTLARRDLGGETADELRSLIPAIRDEMGNEIRSFLDWVEQEVLPYPHPNPRRNRDAEWYFKEKSEAIAAKVVALGLLVPDDTIRIADRVRQHWDSLWAISSTGESVERRNRQYRLALNALRSVSDLIAESNSQG